MLSCNNNDAIPEKITKAMRAVCEYRKSERKDGAELLGIHLEGPFISVKHVGAQPLEYVAKPDAKVLEGYNKESGNSIKIVSMAPEVEGADEMIRYMAKNGIVASIGHYGCGYSD